VRTILCVLIVGIVFCLAVADSQASSVVVVMAPGTVPVILELGPPPDEPFYGVPHLSYAIYTPPRGSGFGVDLFWWLYGA